MRARWLALGLLLGLATLAWGQGGPGFFMSPACSSIANPVTGQTVCWQSSSPLGFYYWDGAAFSPQVLGGPYAPTSFSSGFVLVGGGTGSITATNTPTVQGLTTTGQAALTLGVYGTATGNTGEIRFMELAANGSEYVYIKAPDSIATTWGLKLPTIPGTSGQCLGTDGGNPVTTSWVACSPGAGSGITTLNALTAVTQTFANDTNVTMVSATSTHTLTWAGTLAVSRGGLGVGTLALNGVLVGNGTSAVVVTAAGAADTVLRVPGAGGTPAFGAVDVSKAAAITGLVRTANLGSGTANSQVFLRGDQTWAGAAGTPTYNFVFNSDMEVWGAGTATVPTGWTNTTTGTGSFARNTTAGQFKTGTASLAITRTSGDQAVSQVFTVSYPPVTFWRSQIMTCGGWVRATVAGTSYVQIADDSPGATSSSFHSGGGAFEFLTASRSLGSGISLAQVILAVSNTNTTSQFDSVICVLGSSVANWQPSGWIGRKAIMTHTTGASSVIAGGANGFGAFFSGGSADINVRIPMPFRCVARNYVGRVGSAPVGAETATFQLRNGGTLISPTFVITGAAVQGSDVVNEAELLKGVAVASRVTLSAGAVASTAVATFECEEVPEGI